MPRYLAIVLSFVLALLFTPVADAKTGQDNSTSSDGLSSGDWSSIREAYEAGRHKVQEVDGGFWAHNPGQRWHTEFDGRGFTTKPDSGGWSWGLELLSYGFAAQERIVDSPDKVTADGQQVAYHWDSTVTEWFVNDGRGLEHGFTVHERPGGQDGEGPLVFKLSVRGELVPEVAGNRRGVHFANEAGEGVLNYSGLTAFDADGEVMSAKLVNTDKGLQLIVDENEARYPLTIDPLVQQAYLKASNTDAGDMFGRSVAISGDTIIVGAPGEDSSASGANGNQADNSLESSGAAYIFVRSGDTWMQQAYLKASNSSGPSSGSDQFGTSVAICGDTVVVGASGEDSKATGVDGDQSDNSESASGAAYVFVRHGTLWSQQAYLKASNSSELDEFGSSVAISGDTIVVGAYGEDSDATGVNGNQSNDNALSSGAAYVFVRNGTVWSQDAYLKASNSRMGDRFGSSTGISANTVVVGAPEESSDSTGVNGDQENSGAGSSGAVYVFSLSGSDWIQEAYLKASNASPSDRFGVAVSISGDSLVVGAPNNDEFGWLTGAAYIFFRNASRWSEQAVLKAPVNSFGIPNLFGTDVGINGDTVVVGQPGLFHGLNSAAVFSRIGSVWTQISLLASANTDVGDQFGFSVAVSNDTVVVGAHAEAGSSTGVNGDQSDNSVWGAGAAFVSQVAIDSLVFDIDRISLSAGGSQVMSLDVGGMSAGWTYWMFGNRSGTLPGLSLGNGQILPLNYDSYFQLTVASPFASPFSGYFGQLDSDGKSVAALTVPPGSDPSLVGLILNHAFLATPTFPGADFASNAVSVLLGP